MDDWVVWHNWKLTDLSVLHLVHNISHPSWIRGFDAFLISSRTSSYLCVSLQRKVVWMKPCFFLHIQATTSKRRCGDEPCMTDASFLAASAGEQAATRIYCKFHEPSTCECSKQKPHWCRERRTLAPRFPRWPHGVILCSHWFASECSNVQTGQLVSLGFLITVFMPCEHDPIQL